MYHVRRVNIFTSIGHMQGRARFIVLAIVWVATLSAVLLWFLSIQTERLSIAAGPRDAEAFQLASSIAEVFNAAMSHAHLDVFETGGTSDNIRLLQAGQVDFATAQADYLVDESIAAVASLYFDAYQLIVNAETSIEAFNDLAGRRVAIAPEGSGQNRTFWFVAEHYGLSSDDLVALPMSEQAADFAMIMGQVDAIFRVRAPGNAAIRRLVQDHPTRLVPIDQSQALALSRPSLAPGIVPTGTYRGFPPLPVEDLHTPVLERVLLARMDLDETTVQALTQLLFERHSELVAKSPMAGFIAPLDASGRISIRVHPGARSYYDREKPGFLQQNTRLAASLLYVVAILTSIGVALRSRIQRSRKVRVSDYTLQLMEIAEEARNADTSRQLEALRDRLVSMLQYMIRDLSRDRVTQEEFEHFSFTWQAVDTVVRDRLTFMLGGQL